MDETESRHVKLDAEQAAEDPYPGDELPRKGMRVMPIIDIPMRQDDEDRVQVATAAVVRAALDLGWVIKVVICCDACGVEHGADYIGETRESRFATARAWLVENEGWKCDPDTGDHCRACVALDEVHPHQRAEPTEV